MLYYKVAVVIKFSEPIFVFNFSATGILILLQIIHDMSTDFYFFFPWYKIIQGFFVRDILFSNNKKAVTIHEKQNSTVREKVKEFVPIFINLHWLLGSYKETERYPWTRFFWWIHWIGDLHVFKERRFSEIGSFLSIKIKREKKKGQNFVFLHVPIFFFFVALPS